MSSPTHAVLHFLKRILKWLRRDSAETSGSDDSALPDRPDHDLPLALRGTLRRASQDRIIAFLKVQRALHRHRREAPVWIGIPDEQLLQVMPDPGTLGYQETVLAACELRAHIHGSDLARNDATYSADLTFLTCLIRRLLSIHTVMHPNAFRTVLDQIGSTREPQLQIGHEWLIPWVALHFSLYGDAVIAGREFDAICTGLGTSGGGPGFFIDDQAGHRSQIALRMLQQAQSHAIRPN